MRLTPSRQPGIFEHFDWVLFLLAASLAVIGVVNLYSATSVVKASLQELYIKQVYWIVGGGILGAIVAAIDYRHYERLGYVLYGFGVVLLLLVFVLGKDIRGSSRWIQISDFTLQPSEFMKIFVVIALENICTTNQRASRAASKVCSFPRRSRSRRCF